jgi:hypothetical protein
MTANPDSDFWTWFSNFSEEIREQLATSDIDLRARTGIAELDRRIRQLSPDFRWEIGPFLDGMSFLAISPNGSRDNLLRTRAIVEAAPAIPGWRFLPAKPPKDDKRFGFDWNGVSIDTTKWHYMLVRWENPIQYGVTWIPDSMTHLGDISLDALAWFILDSEIGEEAAISLFEFSEIVKTSTSNATRIEFFRDHFADLRKRDVR